MLWIKYSRTNKGSLTAGTFIINLTIRRLKLKGWAMIKGNEGEHSVLVHMFSNAIIVFCLKKLITKMLKGGKHKWITNTKSSLEKTKGL